MIEEMLKQLLKKSKQKERRSAFTIIELLLAVAIIAVLVGVVMGAINIPGFLGDAHDAERAHNVNQLENAMYQHLVDNWEILNEVDIPEGAANAKDVCKYNKDEDPNPDTTCVDLDGLIPLFMATLPTDPAETNANYTGYKVYKSTGRPGFVAAHLGKLPVEKYPLCDSSLVAYWKFDEDSGSNATDSSGNGNNGTLNGFACTTLNCDLNSGWVSAGRIGNAASFDGTDDYVDAGNDSSLNDLTNYTYSVWINPNTVAPTYQEIITKDTRWVQVGLYMGTSRIRGYRVYSTTDAQSDSVLDIISVGTWQHIVLTYSEDLDRKVHIYVNGLEVTYGTQTTAVGTLISDAGRSLIIGGGSSTARFNGKIDDARVYNRVLSASEITTLASGGGGCS